jgi:probable HAF family extracellular repeat protein
LYKSIFWRINFASILLTIVGVGLIASFAGASGPGVYTLTDLGTLGGANSYAMSINDSGDIAGFSQVPGTDIIGDPLVHAFLYSSTMTDLGTLSGDVDSVGIAINSSGDITGYSGPYGGYANTNTATDHGVLFDTSTSTITDLGTLSSAVNASWAFGINDNAWIVGYSFPGENEDEQSFTYVSGMDAFASQDQYALAINNANVIVGSDEMFFSIDSEPYVACYYDLDDQKPVAIGPDSSTTFDPNSYSTAINNASSGAQITGFVDYSQSGAGFEDDSQAFLYNLSGGTMTMLGLPIGSDTTRGYGLNDSGVVVGTAFLGSGASIGLNNPTNYEYGRGTIFLNGAVYYLDDLVTGSNIDGYSLGSGMSINDNGDIVGFATTSSGAVHAVLLTPTTGAPSAPSAASNLVATDEPGTGISLKWTDNSGGRAYTEIEVSTGSGFTPVVLAGPGTTTTTDFNVTPGATYTFEAVAENSVGSASPSNTSPATYTIPGPTISSITPNSTPANKAVTITVVGANYVDGSVVQINGVSVVTNYKSTTKLKGTLTPGEIKTPAKYAITVLNPGGAVSNSVNLKATGPILTTTIGTMTRTTVISVPMIVTNSGNASADAVTVTSAELNDLDTTTTLPIVLGTIAVGGKASTTLAFPTTAGASGKKKLLTIKGTYTGGTFSFSATETLP